MTAVSFPATVIVNVKGIEKENELYPLTPALLCKFIDSGRFTTATVWNYLDNHFEPVIILTEKEEKK